MEKQASREEGSGAFAALVRVDLLHAFFNASDGRCGALKLRPTRCTAARLARAGFLLRLRPGGFDLLYSGAQARTLASFMAWLGRALPGGLDPGLRDALFGPPLLFEIGIEDPAFFNFTQVPTSYRCGAPSLSLSNLRIAILGKQEAELAVDWKAAPDPQPPAADLSPRDRLAALTGEIVAGWWFEDLGEIRSAEAERRTLLGRTPSGLGFLQIHLAGPSEAPRDAFGWSGFPIVFDPVGPPAAAWDAEGHIQPCMYRARFAARRTHWRYFVSGETVDPGSLSIFNPLQPEQPCFERTGTRILADGTSAACFISLAPLALGERSEASFALKGASSGTRPRPRILIGQLPAAGASAIQPDPGPPERVCSDIFVHL